MLPIVTIPCDGSVSGSTCRLREPALMLSDPMHGIGLSHALDLSVEGRIVRWVWHPAMGLAEGVRKALFRALALTIKRKHTTEGHLISGVRAGTVGAAPGCAYPL